MRGLLVLLRLVLEIIVQHMLLGKTSSTTLFLRVFCNRNETSVAGFKERVGNSIQIMLYINSNTLIT